MSRSAAFCRAGWTRRSSPARWPAASPPCSASRCYAEEAYSELPAARAAAQALGVPLTETTVTADDFFAANRAIQWYLDEPMPNPAEVPLYFLCKAARQRVKVVALGRGCG